MDGANDEGAAAEDGLPAVPALPRREEPALRAAMDGKAKPPGSLGRLEDLAVRLALVAGTARPRMERATLLVFAGDHGLNEDGVSAYPSSVTAAMVATLLTGRASANAVAAAVGAQVRVVDAGVAAAAGAAAPGGGASGGGASGGADPIRHPDLLSAPVRRGTRNAAREPALTPGEVRQALALGVRAAGEAVAGGADAVLLGEMGIGNTASAALLVHRLLPAPLAECIGLGAGHDPAGFARKRAVLERAAARSPATRPLDVLAEFGGCEIAAMAGAAVGAAAAGRPVVVDGFIASAAVLAAIRLQPALLDYCVFAHRSAEKGHARLLAELGTEPLLDLGLRLGEGTGALLAWPLLRAAARLLTDVADLSEVLAGEA